MSLLKTVQQAKLASFELAKLTSVQKNSILKYFSQLLADHKQDLLRANRKDLAALKNKKDSPGARWQDSPLYQRLVLSENKIDQLVQGLQDTIQLEDPCHKILKQRKLTQGLTLTQISTPIGLIAVIFESRPDVIPQVLSLMLKSGNACILKGGKEALHSNKAFMALVEQLHKKYSYLPKAWAQLIETREQVHEILAYHNEIDLVIPRGSNELVQNVMANTKIPVLGHADGVCHIYVEAGDVTKALEVIVDAKTQYPSACNSVETILIHTDIAAEFLPPLTKRLRASGVKLFGCEQTRALLRTPKAPIKSKRQKSESHTEICEPVKDWHLEYGDLRVSIRLVKDVHEAILHINRYGSHHTDAILSENAANIEIFKSAVDSANVMVNASTRFADGFRYGMGAEVGISTAKTHARGPVGLEGLVIYKYILEGEGHIVANYKGPVRITGK